MRSLDNIRNDDRSAGQSNGSENSILTLCMNYQHAHPKLFMAVAVLLTLSGAVLLTAGIANFGDSRIAYSTDFGGHTTESWVLVLSGILCVIFGVSRAFYLWKLLAAQRKKQPKKRG